jgi:hypothetical protein
MKSEVPSLFVRGDQAVPGRVDAQKIELSRGLWKLD